MERTSSHPLSDFSRLLPRGRRSGKFLVYSWRQLLSLSSAAESVEELCLAVVGTGETGAASVFLMFANTRLGVSASDVLVGVLDTAGSQGLSPSSDEEFIESSRVLFQL